MMQEVYKEKAFYFSYEYNLTHSMQRRLSSIGSNAPIDSSDMWHDYDSRFIFNFEMLKTFSDNSFKPFLVPMIFGYVFI